MGQVDGVGEENMEMGVMEPDGMGKGLRGTSEDAIKTSHNQNA